MRKPALDRTRLQETGAFGPVNDGTLEIVAPRLGTAWGAGNGAERSGGPGVRTSPIRLIPGPS